MGMFLWFVICSLEQLLEASSQSGIGIITLNVENRTGYGHIVRKQIRFKRLLSIKMPLTEQRLIQEINTGIYCVSNAQITSMVAKTVE